MYDHPGDRSVPASEVKSMLEELLEDIEIKIDAIEFDIRNERVK